MESQTTDDSLLLALAHTPDVEPRSPFSSQRFRVVRALGEGGFGVVYEVVDQSSGRALALKLLKPRGGASIELLKQEFRSVADVVHPNLVGLHELVHEDGHWFITMDLVDGADYLTHLEGETVSTDQPTQLAAEIRDQRWDRLRSALRQLVEGVLAIHASGKLHLDLKPSNVLVEPSGRVVILDFGLSTDIDTSPLLSVDHPRGGTPAYMSPERLRGEDPGASSDWFSVGVMLYEALTGGLPFGTSARRTDGSPPRPGDISPYVPDELEALALGLLDPDPTRRPNGHAVLEALGFGEAPASRPAPRPPLIGRTGLLKELDDAMARLGQGQPVTVLVDGAPGMGKTALCQHFLATRRETSATLVLPARCYERESVPFKALDGVVDALARVLRRMSRAEAAGLLPRDFHLLTEVFPILKTVPAGKAVPARQCADAQQLRRRAFAALKELLGRLADKQPLVIFIDDLHWGDVDSARLLAELLGPPEPPALLFIGTYRSDERTRSAAMAAFIEATHTPSRVELQVEALPAAEALSFARQLPEGRDLSVSRLRALVRASEGHPLLLTELMTAAHHGREAIGTSFFEVFRRRLDELGQDARALLEVVSVAAQPLDEQLCFQAAGLGSDGQGALRVLRSQHLVRTGPQSRRPGSIIEPYHDRIREAVVQALAPTMAKRRHLDLAATLEEADGDPETLAEHLDAGGEGQRAWHYALLAAEVASGALAFDRAARLYRFALERTTGATRRRDIQEKLGMALIKAGQAAEGAQALLSAADGVDMRLRTRAAMELLSCGRHDEGMAVLRPLLEELEVPSPQAAAGAWPSVFATVPQIFLGNTRLPSRAAADLDPRIGLRLDATLAAARGLEWSDMVPAIALYSRHSLLAQRHGDRTRALHGFGCRLPALSMPWGLTTRVERMGERLERLAIEDDDAAARATMLRLMGCAQLMTSGHWRDCVSNFDRAEDVIRERCPENMLDIRYCRMKATMALVWLGDLQALRRRVAPYLREADDRGDLLTRTLVKLYGEGLLSLANDEPERLEAICEEALVPTPVSVVRLVRDAVRSDARLYRGDAIGAEQIWQEGWPAVERSGLQQIMFFAVMSGLARGNAAVAAGDLGAAKRIARRLWRFRCPTARGARALLLASVAQRRGHTSRARRLLTAAVGHFDAAEMKLHAAAGRLVLGRLTGDTAMVERGHDALAEEGVAGPDRWAAMILPGFEPEPALLR